VESSRRTKALPKVRELVRISKKRITITQECLLLPIKKIKFLLVLELIDKAFLFLKTREKLKSSSMLSKVLKIQKRGCGG
jgi:hypothetical protein